MRPDARSRVRISAVVRLARALLAVVVMSLAGVVHAATEADIQSAFDSMLADPGNVELTLNYARVATDAADYEAAIGALEGLLMMAPDMSNIRMELGILYYRLGSYAAASYHLSRAVADGRLNPAGTVRAEQFLARVDASGKRNLFNGRITAGVRYRTNANSGPDSSSVRARGFDVILRDEFLEEDDGDGFVTANLRHVYDLKRQDRMAWENDLFFYANRQFDLERVNNVIVEGTSGVRWNPFSTQLKGFDWRPHMVFNVVYRDDDRLSNIYGGGVDVSYYTDRRFRITGRFQHRVRQFNNTADRPRIESQRDGHENFFWVNARYLLRDNLSILGRFNLVERETEADFNDALELGIRLRADLTYNSPISILPGRWRFFVGGDYRDTDYDAPNPNVDPFKVRDDKEYRFNVGNAFPITGRLQAILEVSGQFVESNLPNFERDNISTTASISYWF